MPPITRTLVLGLLLGAAGFAQAQAQAQQPTRPAQSTRPVARDIDPNTLVNAGLQVAALVDTGRSGEAWDGASAVAKRSVERKRFVDDLGQQRQPLGAVAARRWVGINRHTTAGTPQLPAGSYANVEFETRFGGNRVGRELVSFRLDEDGTWRLSGYVLK